MVERTIRGTSWRALDTFDDVEAEDDAAEDSVFGVEKIIVCRIDEKLGAISIRASIRHRDRPDFIVIIFMDLVIEFVSRISHSPLIFALVIFTIRIAALDHESGDDTMECGAVIKSALSELHKIGDRIRRILLHHFQNNVPLVGV